MDKLSILEQRIRQRIERTKNQIHESRNKAYIDSILIEINTLNWVLNEISFWGPLRSFYRRTLIPGEILPSKIDAKMNNGILQIHRFQLNKRKKLQTMCSKCSTQTSDASLTRGQNFLSAC